MANAGTGWTQNKVEILPLWVHTDINTEKKGKKEMVEIKQNPPWERLQIIYMDTQPKRK